MKRKLFWAQLIFFTLFVMTAVFTLLQFTGKYNPLIKFDEEQAVNSRNEDYDASLSRLNSIKALTDYCDSFYQARYPNANEKEYEEKYSNLLASIVRKKFFHGYSYYGFNDNYLLSLFSKITRNGYSAVIVPNDILKYPSASCSQQSVVMMEVLRSKNITTRKVGFYGKKYGGHFCFEVFYNGGWHFFDTNLEPDLAVLNAYGRPGIAFLADHPEILTKAYSKNPPEEVLDIFPTYKYGAVNTFPAPNGLVLQKLTRILSYSVWFLFFVLFLYTRRRYRRLTDTNYVWNRRISFSSSYQRAS